MIKIDNEYIIVFRNGFYFQNLAANFSGPQETAQRFDSEKDADKIISRYFTFAGGMAVPVSSIMT